MIEQIKQNFNEIIEIKLNSEGIEIVLNTNNLIDLEKISRRIIDFIEKNDEKFLEKNQVEILSKGSDTQISQSNLNKYLNLKLQINLNKVVNKNNIYVGNVLEFNDQMLTIKWNAKGQMRKQVINWSDIKSIEQYI